MSAVLALGALAACGTRADVEIAGLQAGVTRAQYEALPDSQRFAKESDDSRGETQGVAVDVVLKVNGYKGASIPLDYTLHDARNQLPFVSRRVPVTPTDESWTRTGRLWLPVPSAGTYYVQVVLGDSTGREAKGPRTEDFTIR
ncbi:hypothetical protein [Longimicrobium sp.]|uniref:hypothetical protein n=1 Tax=Longimicrobium sp. TaxID=2029185 RepID=UPI002E33E18D|nr:hypothetical protein [Longimicrobium sp.]HEX6042113.1 hypothetical protein [Longimicrobium sp.]